MTKVTDLKVGQMDKRVGATKNADLTVKNAANEWQSSSPMGLWLR